jgi:hypothetical protein
MVILETIKCEIKWWLENIEILSMFSVVRYTLNSTISIMTPKNTIL